MPDSSTRDSTAPTDGAIAADSTVFDASAEAATPTCVRVPAALTPAVWWRFEGNLDSTYGGTLGPTGAMPTYTQQGAVGQGFDLTAGGLLLRDSARLGGPYMALSVTAWVQPSSATATARIVDKISASGTDGYLLDLLDGHLRMQVGTASVSSQSTIPSDRWTYVAGVFDGTSLRVYVNSVVDGTSVGAVTAANSAATVFHVGVDSNGGSRYVGLLDELTVGFNTLPPELLRAEFDAGHAGRCVP